MQSVTETDFGTRIKLSAKEHAEFAALFTEIQEKLFKKSHEQHH